MRSAETLLRWAGVMALCAGAAGCTSMFKPEVPLGGPPVSAAAASAVPGAPVVSRATAANPASSAATPSSGPATTTASATAAAAAPSAAVVASPAARAAAIAGPSSSTLPSVYGAEPDTTVTPAVQRAYDEARRLMRAGSLAEAERGFRALVLSNPDLGGPHANLGALLRQTNKLPEAVAEGEKAVRVNPRQPAYFNQLGITYRQAGQFAKAREAYETAMALDPAWAAPVLNLGILHDLYLADGKRALELYDKYLALSPGGDAVVTKWVADLKNRKPPPVALGQKEKE